MDGRFWLVAAFATAGSLLVLGVPTAVIPNPFFIRMTPTEGFNVVVWLISAPLIGLLIAMVLNIFLASPAISYVISIVGVVLFTALTAYDVQRIAAGDIAARLGSMEKAAVFGALQLYLVFINLFLFLLRIFGDRR